MGGHSHHRLGGRSREGEVAVGCLPSPCRWWHPPPCVFPCSLVLSVPRLGWWGPPGTSRLTETTNSKASWEKQSSAVKVLAVLGHPEFPVR